MLERVSDQCNVLGAMHTLVVGMLSRELRYMATQAWPWHPLHSSKIRSSVRINSGDGGDFTYRLMMPWPDSGSSGCSKEAWMLADGRQLSKAAAGVVRTGTL
jgi:hypothetical protein